MADVPSEIDLSKFQLKRILQNNCVRKLLCVEGNFTDRDGQAVVVLEKKIFPPEESTLQTSIFNRDTILKKSFDNDIYGSYECYPTKETNGLNVTVIHPATEKHIEKWTRRELHWIEETKEMYEQITLPHVTENCLSLDWVDNILQGKAEQDRIILQDPDETVGFVLLPDLKWDQDKQTLHLLALPLVKLKSIRELTGAHLPLLINIKNKVEKIVEEKYEIRPSQLRLYFHYQPSFYRLHVHCTYLMYDAPGIFVGRAHPLSAVIQNLQLNDNYYQNSTLSCTLSETDTLYSKLKDRLK